MNAPMVNAAQSLALIGNIGWQELLILGVILLILFGRRLPEVGRSLGQGIVQFKKGLRDIEEEVERGVRDEPAHKPPLAEGQDRRVSQGPAATSTPEPAEQPHSGGA